MRLLCEDEAINMSLHNMGAPVPAGQVPGGPPFPGHGQADALRQLNAEAIAKLRKSHSVRVIYFLLSCFKIGSRTFNFGSRPISNA